MNFYELFFTFMVVGLVVVGIFGFTIGVQHDNNVEGITSNSLINNSYNSLYSNLSTFNNKSQTQKDLFESENPTVGFGSLILFSIVSAGKVFNSMIIGVFNIVIRLPVTILGLDPVLVSVISTMLLLTVIIGLWVLYKLGG